jgi:hypothetical protein
MLSEHLLPSQIVATLRPAEVEKFVGGSWWEIVRRGVGGGPPSLEVFMQAIVFALKPNTISRVYQHFTLHSALEYADSPETTGAE